MQRLTLKENSICIIPALCPTTNMTGQINCDTNTLTVTWDPSLVNGTSYTLQTERIGSALPPLVHTTTNTSHVFTDLLCGQRYAFSIATQDGNCLSSYSPSIEISTGRVCQYRAATSVSLLQESKKNANNKMTSTSVSSLSANQLYCSCGLRDKQRELLLG